MYIIVYIIAKTNTGQNMVYGSLHNEYQNEHRLHDERHEVLHNDST